MNTLTDTTKKSQTRGSAHSVNWARSGLLAIVLIALFYVIPVYSTDYWMRAILMPTLILGLAGLGLNLLFGYAGQASLGTAAFMAVGAFAAYNIMLRASWVPLPLAYLSAGVIAGLAGVVFGLPSLRIKGFYLIASTLLAQFLTIWIFTNFGWFYNNNPALTISASNWSVFGYDLSSPTGRYLIVVFTVTVLTWFSYNIVHSQVGRNWMAVRDMDTAAAVIGVPIARTKLTAFFVSSFVCGIAGILWGFAYLGSIDATGFSLDKSFQLLFIAIIGGLGSIFGSYVGAALIVLTPIVLNILTKNIGLDAYVDQAFLSNMQKVLFGSLIIYLLIRQPDGVMKIITQRFARLGAKPKPKATKNNYPQ